MLRQNATKYSDIRDVINKCNWLNIGHCPHYNDPPPPIEVSTLHRGLEHSTNHR